MSTLLFAAHPSLGHLNPLLAIARQLRVEGHTAVFAGFAPPNIQRVFADEDIRFIPVRPAASTMGLLFLPLLSGYPETFMAVRLFFSGAAHYARALGKILEQVRPDAVVADFSFPGAFIAAESKKMPYAVVYHAGLCYKGEGVPPFGSGLPIGPSPGNKEARYRKLADVLERMVEKSLTKARREVGLRTPTGGIPYLSAPSSPWLTLILTAECMEAPRSGIPLTAFFTGPCLAGGKPSVKGFPIEKLSTTRRIVYASLGTVFNNKPAVYMKIIEAFADGKHQLVVSAGRAYEKLFKLKLPSNVILFETVDQMSLLPRVDVVISHGGNNTVNETLAAGKPLLVLPAGGEQGDNASRVEYLGAGLRADMNRITPGEIRELVDKLIEKPSFGRRAHAIAQALARTNGPATASRFIAHLAQTKKPIVRPEGYPLTVTKDLPPPWEFSA
ncbi:MAG: hypothetical protein HZA04_01970 [Nitrospinae bacterium]|nr:hypothetical protein [Nitrospinota bacterium]